MVFKCLPDSKILSQADSEILPHCHISKWFQGIYHISKRFQEPRPISKWFQEPCHCRFRNPAIGIFRNPATPVNGFWMPVGFKNPATSKGNFFTTIIKGWNTLTFVTNSSFLDVTWFLPYANWTLPHLRWNSLRQKLAASLLSQRAAF